ncbi:MAG: NuoM family protein [Gemmatimonas sp.]|jgi:NADH-quinone oxidoreductase subunit M|uniref:complex I subunit 4 family protein n=1 Tax=Gemmatimonas sp. TaxID=1962908 RepID=UPI00391EF3EA|nr:NADH-quinone oxidoreductase subunit M [Gemmatimonadota bacterium]
MRDLMLSLGVDRWVLPALLAWPIVAGVFVRLLGRDVSRDDTGAEAPSGGPDARVLTAAALVVEAALAVALWGVYDPNGRGWQARVDLPWLADLGATFSVGVDGLSLPMVLLTALVMPLTLFGSWDNVRVRTPAFGALVLLLTSGLMGVFVSLDLLLFYLAWELMLIPTYLLVGVWGAAGQSRASLRYVLFTLVGSLLMLVAIIALWSLAGGETLHLDDLAQLPLPQTAQLLMFGAFFAAFGVKSALVPFHTWLPDAQSAAPTLATVTLGLKVGAYAILRFAIPLFPAAATHETVRTVILVCSVVAIVYGALLAMAQHDLKRLISYSSISHLGFIMLGCFALTQQSVQGAVVSIINSGISTTALFLLAGMLEDRRGTTALPAFGGLARVMPWFGVMLTVVMLSTVALPGTNGFVGEFLVLIGTYADRPVLAVVATSGVIFAAAYGMRALQRVLFERLDESANGALVDLSGREKAVMMAFAVAIMYLGIVPQPLLKRVERASLDLIEAVRFGPNAPATLPPVSLSR